MRARRFGIALVGISLTLTTAACGPSKVHTTEIDRVREYPPEGLLTPTPAVQAPASKAIEASLETIPVWRERLGWCNADKRALRLWVRQQKAEDQAADDAEY